MEIAITGGVVIDGTGRPGQKLEVGIDKGRIVEVEPSLSEKASVTIDVSGKVVSPGFIDVHSHSDLTLIVDPQANSKIRQGVTTEIVGNCGFGVAPLKVDSQDEFFSRFWSGSGSDWYGIKPNWRTMAEYFSTLEQRKSALNVAVLASHGTIRFNIMKDSPTEASDSEISEMEFLLEECMESGAFGMSSGLRYKPGCYAKPTELARLCGVVKRHGGLYSTHLRSEGDNGDWYGALLEAIDVALRSGVPLQVSHLKALGRTSWNSSSRVLQLFQDLRTKGMDLTADQYPYDATQTGLTILLPAWLKISELSRIEGSKLSEAKYEISRVLDLRGGPLRITIASSPSGRYDGKNLEQISKELEISPEECVIKLAKESDGKITIVSQSMLEGDVQQIMKQDYVMVASDGYSLSPNGPLASGVTHPRSYGTFPRVLGRYVRELSTLSIEEAIRKMTALPASKFGLEGIGLIRKGAYADIVVFDPSRVSDESTYRSPTKYPSGIEYVIVNGKIVVERWNHTGDLPGRIIRKKKKGVE